MEWNEPVKPLCPVYVCTGQPYHRNKNLPIAKHLDGWEAELRETQYTKVGEGPRSQADFTVLNRNYIMQYIQP